MLMELRGDGGWSKKRRCYKAELWVLPIYIVTHGANSQHESVDIIYGLMR